MLRENCDYRRPDGEPQTLPLLSAEWRAPPGLYKSCCAKVHSLRDLGTWWTSLAASLDIDGCSGLGGCARTCTHMCLLVHTRGGTVFSISTCASPQQLQAAGQGSDSDFAHAERMHGHLFFKSECSSNTQQSLSLPHSASRPRMGVGCAAKLDPSLIRF